MVAELRLIDPTPEAAPSSKPPGVDQSVAIQLPSHEDGEGFLRNIRSNNVSGVDQF